MYINEFIIMILCEYSIYIQSQRSGMGWVVVHTEWYYTIFPSSQRIEQHLSMRWTSGGGRGNRQGK